MRINKTNEAHNGGYLTQGPKLVLVVVVSSVTPLDHRGDRLYITHCPGGVSGYILEPGAIGQLREFESPRVRTPINFRLLYKLTFEKRESVS